MKFSFWILVLPGLAALGHAADWPQGGGPSGDFVAEGAAPTRWSVVHGKNIAWSRPLPETGQSTVVIADGKLFYTCFQPVESDSELGSDVVAFCADSRDGDILWQRPITARHPLRLSGCFSDSTAPPAVTDGQRVCFFNASGTVVCFDMGGKELWRREAMVVGRSQPFLVNGRIIYARQLIMPKNGRFGHEHKNAPRELWTQLEALDLSTGERVWRSECGVNMGAVPLPQKLSDGRYVAVVGRGGGHSPPERPLGVSMVDLSNGRTLWTLPLGGFMSTQTYPVVDDLALVFHGPEHLWVDLDGKVVKRVNFCRDIPVRRRSKPGYIDARETWVYKVGSGRAITQQSNLRVGDYHYFRAYRQICLGRVHVKTGDVEYLHLPAQLVRAAGSDDRMIWNLKDPGFIPADMKNSNGWLVMGDKRSRTNTWGHHASPIMSAVGQYLYVPTMSGTVYCVRWSASRLDENAIAAINDLGPTGPTWSRSSLSFDGRRLYTRTIKELLCIGLE